MGYFDINELDCVILEPKGAISVLPKDIERPIRASDMNIQAKQHSLLGNVIIDGKIMNNNLNAFGKDEKWILDEIKSSNNINIEDVVLATLSENGTLSFHMKDYQIQKNTPLI